MRTSRTFVATDADGNSYAVIEETERIAYNTWRDGFVRNTHYLDGKKSLRLDDGRDVQHVKPGRYIVLPNLPRILDPDSPILKVFGNAEPIELTSSDPDAP